MSAIEKQAELQLSPSFTLTTKGLLIKGSPTYEEWASVGETLRFLESSIQFALGDWIRYGEHCWGEMYAQAIQETGKDAGTLRDYVWVASAVDLSLRDDNLTFSHHKAVASLRLDNGAPDIAKQRHYLELAAEEDYPVSTLRRVIKEDKQAGNEVTIPVKIFDKVVPIRRRGDAVIFICDAVMETKRRYRVVVYEV